VDYDSDCAIAIWARWVLSGAAKEAYFSSSFGGVMPHGTARTCSLKAIERPYSQAFPPFCQFPLLRTNKPSITQQLLSKNSFTGALIGTLIGHFNCTI
jgi:hypothetical protein